MLTKVFEDGKLIGLDIVNYSSGESYVPTDFEREVVRIFNEHRFIQSQLAAKDKEIERLKESLDIIARGGVPNGILATSDAMGDRNLIDFWNDRNRDEDCRLVAATRRSIYESIATQALKEQENG
jgi:hypothetical protein